LQDFLDVGCYHFGALFFDVLQTLHCTRPLVVPRSGPPQLAFAQPVRRNQSADLAHARVPGSTHLTVTAGVVVLGHGCRPSWLVVCLCLCLAFLVTARFRFRVRWPKHSRPNEVISMGASHNAAHPNRHTTNANALWHGAHAPNQLRVVTLTVCVDRGMHVMAAAIDLAHRHDCSCVVPWQRWPLQPSVAGDRSCTSPHVQLRRYSALFLLAHDCLPVVKWNYLDARVSARRHYCRVPLARIEHLLASGSSCATLASSAPGVRIAPAYRPAPAAS
jgi:hypothetical protein